MSAQNFSCAAIVSDWVCVLKQTCLQLPTKWNHSSIVLANVFIMVQGEAGFESIYGLKFDDENFSFHLKKSMTGRAYY